MPRKPRGPWPHSHAASCDAPGAAPKRRDAKAAPIICQYAFSTSASGGAHVQMISPVSGVGGSGGGSGGVTVIGATGGAGGGGGAARHEIRTASASCGQLVSRRRMQSTRHSPAASQLSGRKQPSPPCRPSQSSPCASGSAHQPSIWRHIDDGLEGGGGGSGGGPT